MQAGQVDFGSERVHHNILSVAAPMMAAQLLNLLYNIIDRIYIGKIPGEGTIALAGLGLCFPVVTMVIAFANLFGAGGAPLCLIARGKKETRKAQDIMSNAFFMLVITGIILTIAGILFHRPLLYLFGASDATYFYASGYMAVYVFPEFFIRIFNHNAELIRAAVPSMHLYFFGFFMMAFQFAGQIVFKSLNKAKQAIFFSLLRKAVIVVPLTLILPRIGGLGVMGVFLAEPVSNFIGGLACYVTMRKTILAKLP